MRLGAAVRGEYYRTVRNRAPLFWAYALPPLLLLLLALVEVGALVQAGVPPRSRSLAEIAVRPLWSAGNPLIHLFYAIGAAALFAGEYRLETWRLLAPRSTRWSLIAAKFLVYLLLVAASLGAGVAISLVLRGAALALSGHGEGLAPTAAGLGRIALAFAASLSEAAVIGSLSALVAVVARSVTAAILVPFLLSLGAMLALEYFTPAAADGRLLLVPPLAGDAVRLWASGEASLEAGAAAAATAALAAWAVLLALAAAFLFHRQDLAKE